MALLAISLRVAGYLWVSAIFGVWIYMALTDVVVYAPGLIDDDRSGTWLLAMSAAPGLGLIALGWGLDFEREDKRNRELR